MDVERAIVYVFDDPDWLKKVAIGGLLLLVPIFGWLVVAGYGMRLIRCSYLGEDRTLPQWDDFGGDAVRGLKAMVVLFIWSIPFWVIQFAVFCLIFPFAILGEMESVRFSVVFGLFAGLGTVGMSLLATVVQFLYLLVLPLFLGRVATSDRIESAFDLSAIVREARLVPGPLIIVALLQVAISSVASIGMFLCLIGIVFTMFLGYAVVAHLVGQVRREIDMRSVLSPEPAMRSEPSS